MKKHPIAWRPTHRRRGTFQNFKLPAPYHEIRIHNYGGCDNGISLVINRPYLKRARGALIRQEPVEQLETEF